MRKALVDALDPSFQKKDKEKPFPYDMDSAFLMNRRALFILLWGSPYVQ